ncbi:chromate transporter [Fervidobacterium changbaicum]|uniref:Chromate transporter n=1 Tax=Fervidobacterium changbaicum TaxID=310769 RepID=A0ABX5QPK3_9BACT|nr:chromate transporter [Fervidobacterium changbaicum]QAV32387.1 chromate transporter [Fervidobacterium changbaicum]SDH17749.1 chromate transporter [Fervidobacterium changbaicum]
MIYLKLFLAFIQIGAISFGGGYSILKAIIHYVVDINKWLTLEQFNEIVAISQSTPGPIGINAATFVGYKVGGIFGSLIATFSVILVPVLSSLFLYFFYRRHSENKVVQTVISKLKPVVLAMIASAAFSFLRTSLGSPLAIIINVVAIAVLLKTKIDAVTLLLLSGILGYIVFR